MTAGRNPFARSKARMWRVDSRPWVCVLAEVQNFGDSGDSELTSI